MYIKPSNFGKWVVMSVALGFIISIHVHESDDIITDVITAVLEFLGIGIAMWFFMFNNWALRRKWRARGIIEYLKKKQESAKNHHDRFDVRYGYTNKIDDIMEDLIEEP